MTVFPISIDGRGNTKGPDTATTQMVGAVVSFLHLLRPQPQSFVLVGSTQEPGEEFNRIMGIGVQKGVTSEIERTPVAQLVTSILVPSTHDMGCVQTSPVQGSGTTALTGEMIAFLDLLGPLDVVFTDADLLSHVHYL